MKHFINFAFLVAVMGALLFSARGDQPSDHLVLEAQGEPRGKHIVLLAGDEEYRSEEGMPMMAHVLSKLGFKCTVLFSMDDSGTFVSPDNQESLSNPAALDTADAIVMLIRFRNWTDSAFEKFEAAFHRGVPIVALRTSTHAFQTAPDSRWAKYSYDASADTGWEKGFGRQVLGETWVSHHGEHGIEGTRSVVEPGQEKNPILNSVGSIFATTDVYGAYPKEDSTILLRGQVTRTLHPVSPPVEGEKNDPMTPIAWTREFENSTGTTNKIFTTTMGASTDLADEDLRRLIVNAVFAGLRLDVPAKADVSIDGTYEPTPYGFDTYQVKMRPADFLIR